LDNRRRGEVRVRSATAGCFQQARNDLRGGCDLLAMARLVGQTLTHH
jgi:hypothetical protein